MNRFIAQLINHAHSDSLKVLSRLLAFIPQVCVVEARAQVPANPLESVEQHVSVTRHGLNRGDVVMSSMGMSSIHGG